MRSYLKWCWLIFLFSLYGVTGYASLSSTNLRVTIDRANRSANWEEVLSLGAAIEIASVDDLHQATAVVSACVVLNCQRETFKPRIVIQPKDAILKFLDAWFLLVGENPARAASEFSVLSRDETAGWLGMYGMLEYSMNAENSRLLKEWLEISAKLKSPPDVFQHQRARAQFMLAELSGDRKKAEEIAFSNTSVLPPREKAITQIRVLSWINQLEAAHGAIRSYIKRYGYDQDISGAEIDLEAVRLDDARLHALISRRFREYPQYWHLERSRLVYAPEKGLGSLGPRAIAFGIKYPRRLAVAKLMELEVLADRDSLEANRIIASMSELTQRYRDFQSFHLALIGAHVRLRDHKQALQWIDRALLDNPHSAPVFNLRAAVGYEVSDYKMVVDSYSKIVEIQPNDVYSRIFLAGALGLLGEVDRALGLLDAVDKSPRYKPKKLISEVREDLLLRKERRIRESLSK